MAQTGWLDPELSPQQLLDRQTINGVDVLNPLYGEADAAGPPGGTARETGWLGRELSPQQLLDRELMSACDLLSPLYAEVPDATSQVAGTLSQTIVLSLTASGTVLVQGALSKSVTLSLSASATTLTQGSLSRTLPLGFTANGTVVVQSSLSQGLSLTLSASGAVTFAGSNGNLSQTLGLILLADGTVPVIPHTGGPKPKHRSFELDVKPTKREPLPPQKRGLRRIPSVKVALSLTAPSAVILAEVGVAPLFPITASVRLPGIKPPALAIQGQVTSPLGLANERIDNLEALLLVVMEDD